MPAIWPITPSNSLVVAWPRILGPTMVKTVEATAKSITIRIGNLVGAEILDQLAHGALEIAGFLALHHGHGAAVPHRAAAASAHGPLPGRLRCAASSLSSLMPVPPCSTARGQFPDRSRSFPSAPDVCPCRRSAPSSSTMIWSAFLTVATRWVTISTVLSPVFSLSALRRADVGLEVQGREAVVEDDRWAVS